MSPRVQRAIVAVSTMMATFLVILDVTIANVALDHMRGSLSAARTRSRPSAFAR